MKTTEDEGRVKGAMARARAHSPFLRHQFENFPHLVELLHAGRVDEALSAALQPEADAADVPARLRIERGGLALVLAVGDLAGCLPLERVVGTLSDFADNAVDRALADVMTQRIADVEPRGFSVVALGKHGSRELNYSSDIDLLLLFDPQTLPLRPREEPGQAAVRIGQKFIEALQRRDAGGYVFRIDLRLRPSPEVTPIALPVDAAISYYESSALPWERAAYIRARVVGGDRDLGRYFLDAIQPFVWRRSLDFGAIGEIQSITARIRDHYSQGQNFGPGYDLKRGQGGIREIEFYAQIHQLIHGGRDPALRAPATLDALAALAAAGRIDAGDAAALGDAYRLLRTMEHRLQMVDDRQTHSLPADAEALDGVAALDGQGDGAALLDRIRSHVERVAALYDTLGVQDGARLPASADRLEARLDQVGFADPAAARARIESWRSGTARSLRAPAAREAFEAMLPALIDAFGAAPHAMDALNRFDDLVSRLPSGVNFYRLLEARPKLTATLAIVLSHAPPLAEQLGRRPELLDGLIDESALSPAGTVDALATRFAQRQHGHDDYQAVLDQVRRHVNERRFALGVQLIGAISDPIEVAGGYARIAEAALRVLADAAIAEFEAAHGRVAGSELVVLGLGRLGGKALTHASDLDLVYLFTGTHEGRSDGAKPLGATEYFNRLAQRVTAALSVPTAAGPLYDVDTRLRPSGQDGLLAVSLASFAEYQRSQAWTWEHMALTRARPVYGSDMARAALSEIIEAVLRQPRDPQRTRSDAAAMRRDLAAHKPPKGPFDIKLGDGGLVDLEFAVQTLQLIHHRGLSPQLDSAITDLAAAGLAPAAIGEAHRFLTRLLVTLRLVSPASEEPAPASQALVAQACMMRDWDALIAAHDEARQTISAFWRCVAGQADGVNDAE